MNSAALLLLWFLMAALFVLLALIGIGFFTSDENDV
jgi:hypothetical protein